MKKRALVCRTRAPVFLSLDVSVPTDRVVLQALSLEGNKKVVKKNKKKSAKKTEEEQSARLVVDE